MDVYRMEDSVHTVPGESCSPGSRARRSAGFTIFELMVTVSIAGILFAVATPNLRVFLQNNRLSAASNDLLRSFQVARSEAIKRQQDVVVCASANPTVAQPTCSYGKKFNGWIVFQDTNSNWVADMGEPILERHDLLDSTITVKNDNDGIESYAGTGFAKPIQAKSPTRNILICDVRGNQVSATSTSIERAVLITTSGRVRVSRVSDDITSAMDKTGACP
jgi:type IV fimbrial biogenesis protein FimT